MRQWFSLPHLSGLVVSGPDALDFCHSQFTADLHALVPGHWQITTWCNSKGRVLVTILTARHENHVEIIVPRVQIGILDKLSMYSIGRKVSIESIAEVSGSFIADPDKDLAPDSIIGDRSRALRLASSGCDPTPAQIQAWQLADLATPLPWLTADTTARFLPQTLSMESNGGLSYKKGCFPGQEIIARVHYLGQARYHLMGFEIDLVQRPEARTEKFQLRSDTDPVDASPITLIDAVDIDSHLIGLAVASTRIQADHPITAHGPDWELSGQMTVPERLCYYRSKISIN